MADKESDKPRIECRPDGPYLVRNLPGLVNSRDENLEVKAVYALCRCGQSSNKPFCDGTHSKVGFTSARERNDLGSTVDNYPRKEGTLTDNRGICAHVGYCTEDLPSVFRLGQEPWIDPDGADPDAVRKAVQTCPSGALGWKDSEKGDDTATESMGITILKDGPYAVSGGLELVDDVTHQKPYQQARFALCRCGQSKNKPFCDGSHWEAGFQDDRN